MMAKKMSKASERDKGRNQNSDEAKAAGAKSKGHVKRSLIFILGLAWEKKPILFLVYFIQLVVEVSRTMLTVILPKYIIDYLMEVLQGKPFNEVQFKLLLTIGILIGSHFLCNAIANLTNAIRASYGEWFNRYLEEDLARHAMTMDFEHTEDPAALDQLNKAKEGINWYSGGVVGILTNFYTVVMNVSVLIGIVTIIVVGCPWLLLIQGISLCVVTYYNYLNNKIEVQSFLELSALNRKFGYYFYQLADFRLGKDIRLYDSVDMMGQKADEENRKMLKVWARRMTRQRRNSWKMDIVNSLRDSASYFYLGALAIMKIITIGDFTMYSSAAGNFFWALFRIVSGVQEVVKRCNYIHEYIVFLQYPMVMEKGDGAVEEAEHVIEFRDVSFRYPRTDRYILRHVNLKITPSEHLSIVGLNGAGKTTFIKLLCRLYDVNEGAILLDGRDIKEYSDEEYRKLFAVVFQDFQLFAFSLKENVALDQSSEAVEEEIEKALVLSGVYEDAVKLEKGLDTVIYKSFDEQGTELSGGQRQKVAISRAMYKDAPIVILDEPTAALDPMAEYEIYRKFNDLVGGKTAIYISHRLSSCKFCDRIAVFAEDHIKEYGTHEELIEYDEGIYATMFRAQAGYYV
ncbi:MAG TPA: ABC transporter ATP-binding protein [Mobilitalea sp.]|nr:ABC transporter ATP-binding protein [Mobilitalea sp.]